MNKGQEQFLGFILDKTASDKHDVVKELLNAAFEKQDSGTFGLNDVTELAPKLLGLVKNEHIDEVKGIMGGFAKNFGR